jgi:hypothetical protein
MRPPERLTELTVDLGERPIAFGAEAARVIRRELLAEPGVREAVVVPEERAAYLKVDSRRVDSARLHAICGSSAVDPTDRHSTEPPASGVREQPCPVEASTKSS